MAKGPVTGTSAFSAMQNQAANFVRAIKGEGKPPCEAAEALEDLKVAREYIRMLLGR
jgi:predicted dehydrogenase